VLFAVGVLLHAAAAVSCAAAAAAAAAAEAVCASPTIAWRHGTFRRTDVGDGLSWRCALAAVRREPLRLAARGLPSDDTVGDAR
jgi:hypothetical protein